MCGHWRLHPEMLNKHLSVITWHTNLLFGLKLSSWGTRTNISLCCVFSSSVLVINGIQAPKHENGLSGGEASHFEEIIHLSNHGGANSSGREKSESDIPNEPILAFDGGNTFLKKASPMKPQHVAGELRGNTSTAKVLQHYIWAEEKKQNSITK